MRIFLLTPLAKYTGTRWIPLGLGYISSALKEKGHDVRLYDRFRKGLQLRQRGALDRDMKKEITGFRPDIIGLTTISPLIYDTAHCVEYIRGFYDGIIIAGGHHATAMPELTLSKIPGLDYTAAGEAEYIMTGLAGGKDPGAIPGMFSRKGGQPGTGQRYIKDLDELPQPDYRIFDMDYYTKANQYTIKAFYLRTACVLTQRGCPNNCEFCTESLTFGRGVRFHSPDYIIENIGRLVADYNVEGIYFHDNNFLASPAHAENVCRSIIRSGLNKKIRWEMQTGTPTINDEVLSLLSGAGCVKIELGIESIREEDLKDMNKNADNGINRRAVRLCQEHGIAVHTNFMTGFKRETTEDLGNIIKWIRELKPHTFSFHQLQVYPGTRLYGKIGDGFFEKNEWTENNVTGYFNSHKYDNTDLKDKRKWLRYIYVPFNKSYIRKSILKVNSFKNILKMALDKIMSLKYG